MQNTKKNHKIIQKSKKITKFEKNTKTEHVNIYIHETDISFALVYI